MLAVKPQASNWSPIIIIKDYCIVRFTVAPNNTVRRNLTTDDGAHNTVTFKFFICSVDILLKIVLSGKFWRRHLDRILGVVTQIALHLSISLGRYLAYL